MIELSHASLYSIVVINQFNSERYKIDQNKIIVHFNHQMPLRNNIRHERRSQ